MAQLGRKAQEALRGAAADGQEEDSDSTFITAFCGCVHVNAAALNNALTATTTQTCGLWIFKASAFLF